MKLAPAMILSVALLFASGCASRSHKPSGEPAMRWYKGNTHTHTLRSDGDSEPAVVALWYKDRGYDFLVLTDHNVLVDPALTGIGDENFLLIPGEEVSATYRGTFEGAKPIHVNALDPDRVVEPVNEQESVAMTMQANIDAIRAANGIPHINHPNFRWAITHLDLLEVQNCNLLEIYNGHPLVNNDGNDEVPGMEKVWDILLTRGKRIHGIATDDAHHFTGEFAPERSNPGRGWVMVRSSSLDPDEILDSLEKGDFYFTTGPLLESIRWNGKELVVSRDKALLGGKTIFIGGDGKTLMETGENPARCRLPKDEPYVRAKLVDPAGGAAWTQAFFAGEKGGS